MNALDAGRVREPAGTTAPGCGGHEPGAEPSHGTAEKPTPRFTASRGEPRQRAQRPRCCASSVGRAGAGRWAPEGAPSPAAAAGGEGAPPRGSGGAAGDRRPRAPPVRCEPAPGRPWSPSPKGRPGSRRSESGRSPRRERGRSRWEIRELFPCVTSSARRGSGLRSENHVFYDRKAAEQTSVSPALRRRTARHERVSGSKGNEAQPPTAPRCPRGRPGHGACGQEHGGHAQGPCFLSRTWAAEAAQPSWERRVPYFEVSRKMDPETLAWLLRRIKRGRERPFGQMELSLFQGRGRNQLNSAPSNLQRIMTPKLR